MPFKDDETGHEYVCCLCVLLASSSNTVEQKSVERMNEIQRFSLFHSFLGRVESGLELSDE
jgi:hypothetical protein